MDTEAAQKRQQWTLDEARANVAMGYDPERESGRTGWPVALLTPKRKPTRAQIAEALKPPEPEFEPFVIQRVTLTEPGEQEDPHPLASTDMETGERYATPEPEPEPEPEPDLAEVRELRPIPELAWNQGARDFMEVYGMDAEVIEAAVYNPTSIKVDPHSGDVDYPIERRRRGDIEVTVGFRDPARPMVLFVHLFTPDAPRYGGAGSAGGGGRHNTPTNRTDLIKRAQQMGYVAEYGQHTQLKWTDGRVAAVVPGTTGDRRGMLVTWQQLMRWHRENVIGDNGQEAL